MACSRKLDLRWIDATDLEKSTQETAPTQYYKAWHELSTGMPHFSLSPRAEDTVSGFLESGCEGVRLVNLAC